MNKSKHKLQQQKLKKDRPHKTGFTKAENYLMPVTYQRKHSYDHHGGDQPGEP